jgi:hypothetical protein
MVKLVHYMERYDLSLMQLAFQPYYAPDYGHMQPRCVTQLENTVVDSSTMTASEKFIGSNPKWFKNLRTFGEIGITYNNQKNKGQA